MRLFEQVVNCQGALPVCTPCFFDFFCVFGLCDKQNCDVVPHEVIFVCFLKCCDSGGNGMRARVSKGVLPEGRD